MKHNMILVIKTFEKYLVHYLIIAHRKKRDTIQN